MAESASLRRLQHIFADPSSNGAFGKGEAKSDLSPLIGGRKTLLRFSCPHLERYSLPDLTRANHRKKQPWPLPPVSLSSQEILKGHLLGAGGMILY